MSLSFHQTTLANGLTIIAEVDPAAASAAAGFYVRTGARDEDPQVMGVSHFLEHMMFKGTPDISAEELNRRFDAMGARNNAFTSSEMTCFYAQVTPDKLLEATQLLGRMLRPALRDADFETEKGVILEEIAMYKDNPFWVLYESCLEHHFPYHPLSHRVLGTEQTIRDLTSAQMRTYFEARYSADNTVLALAGKMDFRAVVACVEEWCGAWRATRLTRDELVPMVVGDEFESFSRTVNRAYLIGMAEAPGVADESRYAASMLAHVIGGADNSLLHWALVEPGLAEEAQASYSPHDGRGEFLVFASGDPDRHEEIWDELWKQVRRAYDVVGEDDLVRLRNKAATAAALGAERPADRMHRIGQAWTYRREYRPLEEELAKILAVTVEDVKDVCLRYPPEPATIGRLLPMDQHKPGPLDT